MSAWHLIRAASLMVAGSLAIYALLLRERLVTELLRQKGLTSSDFPVHVPLLLERAHRAEFPSSAQRTRFHYAYLGAVSSATLAALATILLDFGF